MWKCQECGRKFRTAKAGLRAANNGCPGCGGVDIDIDSDSEPKPRVTIDQSGQRHASEQLWASDPWLAHVLEGGD
jgi:predicted  nucleic acid-binding Zn-ribbon protein